MKTVTLSVYGTGGEPIKDFACPIGESDNIISLLEELKSKNMLPKRFKPMDDFQDLLVIVNRENIMPREWANYYLNNGDRVLVLSALAGG